jgi:hypothetical protein
MPSNIEQLSQGPLGKMKSLYCIFLIPTSVLLLIFFDIANPFKKESSQEGGKEAERSSSCSQLLSR